MYHKKDICLQYKSWNMKAEALSHSTLAGNVPDCQPKSFATAYGDEWLLQCCVDLGVTDKF